MARILVLLLVALLPGCAATSTTCLRHEAGRLFMEDINSGKELNHSVGSFVAQELRSGQGIGRDLTIGAERETILPDVYYREIDEIFTNCR